MLKTSRFLLSSVMLAAVPLSYVGCASAADEEMKPAPVYIKLEIEDFAGLGAEGSTAPWQPRMAWYPQWSRGGDSGWWGAQGPAAAATGEVTQQIDVPQDGQYSLWVRYEDYTGKAEPFDVVVQHGGGAAKAEFGRTDVVTQAHPQISWNYAWDKKTVNLTKGAATVRVALPGAAAVRRGVDAIVLTTDANWKPANRGFAPQAYANYLLQWAKQREPLKPLVAVGAPRRTVPQAWTLPKTAGRDFWYFGATDIVAGYPFPIRISPEVGNPGSAAAFAARYAANPKTAPIFSAPATAIQIAIAQLGELLKPDNAVRQYILANKRPFVIVGNYNSAGKVANSYQQLQQTFGDLWIGIISGENSYLGVPFLPDNAPAGAGFKEANYQWLLTGGKSKWQQTLSADWASPIADPFEKLISGLSVGTVPHVHQLAEAGAQTLGAESAGASPYIQWQAAFVRGAARQYGRRWTWYYGASFGDAIRTFTNEGPYVLDLEGMKIDNRNATIGTSLAHTRRTLLNAYLQSASFFHPEQGYNLFDTNGQLNPMGWSYDEMLRLATRHPDRGVINTPVAVLLDKAHGWDKYTYGGMHIWDKQALARPDRMIDQFFNVAYFPFPKNEGDPVNDLNVAWPNGYFGDSFDVLVTSPTRLDAVQAYPVVFCVGNTRLDAKWAQRLKQYVSDGGTLVINAEQVVAGMDDAFLGAKLGKAQKEASGVVCTRDNEKLAGTVFPYREATATTAQVIARTSGGDPVALLNKVGKGRVILTTPSYLLGHDNVAMPYMAHLMLELTSGLQPVEVRGNCQHSVNLRSDGYVVTVSNNEGLVKTSHAPATMDMNKTSQVTLRMQEKPLLTEDWIGEEPRPWSFPNEWLPEYTQPKKLNWQQEGAMHTATVKLLPGEIRVYFIKTK